MVTLTTTLTVRITIKKKTFHLRIRPKGNCNLGGVQQPGCGTSVLDSIEKEHGSVLFGKIKKKKKLLIKVLSIN